MAASGLAKSSLWEITSEDITFAGLSQTDAAGSVEELQQVAVAHPREGSEADIWRDLVDRRLPRPDHPHQFHQLVYYSVYAKCDVSARGPPPYWIHSKNKNLGRVMKVYGPKLLGTLYDDPIASVSLFQKFLVEHPEVYSSIIVKKISVIFHESPRTILDTSDKSMRAGTWFPGAVLNIAECCLLAGPLPDKTDESTAII